MIPSQLFDPACKAILEAQQNNSPCAPKSLIAPVKNSIAGGNVWTKLDVFSSTVFDGLAGLRENRYFEEIANSPLVKSATAGAVVGAVIAIPLPIIGWTAGAPVGAIIGTAHYLIKDLKGK